MAATARTIPVTDTDLSGNGGGLYSSLEVPGDYEAVLASVEDYDKRSEGKSYGWMFTYDVETPTGATVDFRVWLSFSESARWKLVEILTAHDVDLEAGLNEVDPNALVGDVVGVHIDFPRNSDGETTGDYRELQRFFTLSSEAPQIGDTVLDKVAERAAKVGTLGPEDGAAFGEGPEDPPMI